MSCNLSRWGRRLIPGSLSALGVLLLLKLGMFQPLEQAKYRLLFQLRGLQAWDERLVLIAIDDRSLNQIGRFPWQRQQYVKLLQVLSQADDSNIVVFNLLFSEPSADDGPFAAAMEQHGKVILAQAWDAKGAPLLPVPELKQNALGVGHILTRRESDAIVRQVAPQIVGVPALGVIMAQAYSLTHSDIPLPPSTTPFWLNWVGPAQTMPQYSFAAVVQGKVSPQAFSNKIVLIGVTAAGIDPLITPFDRDPPATSVLLHATLLQNLLQGTLLQPLSTVGLLLLFLAGGPLLGWALLGRGWLKQIIAVAGVWATWYVFAVLLLKANVMVPMASPLALFLITGSATGFYDRWREATALRYQLDAIQQNETLKDEFLRTASHELRTPVANIQSLIMLLRTAQSKEDWEEYLQILEEECRQEAALIKDLLDFQRLSSNQQPIELETYALKDWMTEVVTPFIFRAEANGQQMQFEADCAELTLDWLSLRRILNELLNNACKYTPPQEMIRISARLVASQLELQVSNSGVTLTTEDLTKIFEPFYRVPDLDYRVQGGTGLGLSIIKRLAEHLGGKVEVVNQGNVLRFNVLLPVVIEPVALLDNSR